MYEERALLLRRFSQETLSVISKRLAPKFINFTLLLYSFLCSCEHCHFTNISNILIRHFNFSMHSPCGVRIEPKIVTYVPPSPPETKAKLSVWLCNTIQACCDLSYCFCQSLLLSWASVLWIAIKILRNRHMTNRWTSRSSHA